MVDPSRPATAVADARRSPDLRAAAAALRAEAAAIADTIRTLDAYDRDDVWSGRVAEVSRARRTEAVLRLASPYAGALAGICEVARRLEVRADLLDGEVTFLAEG